MTRAREHNNTMQINIKLYASARTHPLNSCPCAHIRCLRTRIYIEDMRTKKVNECAVTSERIVFIKTVNSNVMPTLRGFRWYPYFVAQE